MKIGRFWPQWIALGLLCLAFGLMTYNAQAQSATMDEKNHIARGYALWRTGDPRLSLEHPPLINALEAAPLLLLGPEVQVPLADSSWETAEWYRFATLFMWEVNHDADRMVFLARLPVIAMTLMLAAVAWRWARELGGRWAGLAALTLVLCDPNFLAHGGLATTDVGVTFTAFLALYALWRVANRFTARRVVAAGLAGGLLLASKLSAPAFWAMGGLLFVGDGLRRGWREVGRRMLAYAAMSLLAVFLLWANYVFQMAPAVEGGPALPMGLYWRGLLTVLNTVQGGRPAYLLGQTTLEGWAWYFPIAFAVKTPLSVLLLLLAALPAAVLRRSWRADAFLVLPAALYAALAMRSALNLGYRHLLPLLPFLYVWIAQVVRPLAPMVLRRVGLALLLCLGVEMLSVAPYFLASFNVLGGGPTQGWRILADSNIDWGQDLKRLRDYLAANDVGDIKLSWFGTASPEEYGIAYTPLPGLPHYYNMWFEPATFNEQQPEPGVYVISVSNLVELPLEDKHFFAYFRARQPDARIGYSIYIYRVGP